MRAFLIVLVLPCVCFGAELFRIRGFAWGTSLDEVAKAETAKGFQAIPQTVSGRSELLVMGDKLMGSNAFIRFRFEDDGLCRLEYLMSGDGELFSAIGASLLEKYGNAYVTSGADAQLVWSKYETEIDLKHKPASGVVVLTYAHVPDNAISRLEEHDDKSKL